MGFWAHISADTHWSSFQRISWSGFLQGKPFLASSKARGSYLGALRIPKGALCFNVGKDDRNSKLVCFYVPTPYLHELRDEVLCAKEIFAHGYELEDLIYADEVFAHHDKRGLELLRRIGSSLSSQEDMGIDEL